MLTLIVVTEQLVTSKGNYAINVNGIVYVGRYENVVETRNGVRLALFRPIS